MKKENLIKFINIIINILKLNKNIKLIFLFHILII